MSSVLYEGERENTKRDSSKEACEYWSFSTKQSFDSHLPLVVCTRSQSQKFHHIASLTWLKEGGGELRSPPWKPVSSQDLPFSSSSRKPHFASKSRTSYSDQHRHLRNTRVSDNSTVEPTFSLPLKRIMPSLPVYLEFISRS